MQEANSEAIRSKSCDHCTREFRGFGLTCAACRRSPTQQGDAHRCTQCGSFFSGFSSVCSDCRGDEASDLNAKAYDILAQGSLRILDAGWLLERPESYVIQRHQDLPSEAFVPPRAAAKLFTRLYGLVVLSYPWLRKGHPDPTGFHFRLVRQYLAKHVAFFSNPGADDFGVFWDFAALPQPGTHCCRNLVEQEVLRVGLGAINLIYGSDDTVVVQLTAMPEADCLGTTLNLLPYWKRGWCLFEATVSSVVKPHRRLLDLGLAAARQTLADEASDWYDVLEVAGSKRAPLVTPARMSFKLAGMAFTQGNIDRKLVEQKYADFFNYVARNLKVLKLTCSVDKCFERDEASDWNDEERHEVVESMSFFGNAEELWIGGHKLDDADLNAILQLSSMKYLSKLHLEWCVGFTGLGFKALMDHHLSSLLELYLAGTGIGDDGLRILMGPPVVVPQLRLLHLCGCTNIGNPGFAALVGGLPLLTCIEQLWLGRTNLDDQDLSLLALALPNLSRLSRLDLRACPKITTAGLAALARCMPALPVMELFDQAVLPARKTPMESQKTHWMICFMCWHSVEMVSGGHSSKMEFTCPDCAYGALWVPSRLQDTQGGLDLAQAWVAGGRAEHQLRWC